MAENGAAAPARPMVGILFVVLATLAFALSDTVTKHLAMLYPVPVVMAVRYLVNLGLLALFLWPGLGARLWRAQRFWLLILRGLCLAAASLTMGWALRVMPVGETVAIIYLAPFAVMLLAVPLLGEKVSPVGWAGAVFGFVGVLLIVRPGAAASTRSGCSSHWSTLVSRRRITCSPGSSVGLTRPFRCCSIRHGWAR